MDYVIINHMLDEEKMYHKRPIWVFFIGEKGMIKLLVFDGATQKTGVARFINGSLDSYDLIDLHKNKDSDERICQMGKAIIEEIRSFKPDVVYVEDSFQKQSDCRNVKTVKMLSQLMGMSRIYCFTKGIEWHSIYPSEWRKYCFSQAKMNREELKQATREYVFEQSGLNIDSEDVNDAICIGYGILNYYNTLQIIE